MPSRQASKELAARESATDGYAALVDKPRFDPAEIAPAAAWRQLSDGGDS